MRKVYWVLPLFLTACKNDKQENGSVIFGNQPVTEEMRETGSIADAGLASNQESQHAGEQYTDLTLPRLEGGEARLSDYISHNKVTIIDCWASWCHPCMNEMPNIAMLYRKYHNLGLEIVGVSFDEDQRSWNSAVKNHDMVWPQLGELKGWDNQMAATYGVTSIPHTIVINKDGRILARGLRGEDLLNAVANALKN